MRNPSRVAAMCGGAILAMGLLFWLGLQRQNALGKDDISGIMMATGVGIGFPALIFLFRPLMQMRGLARLRAGDGLIAQWHVGASDWDNFREVDAARAATNHRRLINVLRIGKLTSPDRVEVIVGKKAMIIDGTYHALSKHGPSGLTRIEWLDHSALPGCPPDCLEFQLMSRAGGRYGGIAHRCLRVPVPEDARVQGVQAYNHFAAVLGPPRGPIALRNPKGNP